MKRFILLLVLALTACSASAAGFLIVDRILPGPIPPSVPPGMTSLDVTMLKADVKVEDQVATTTVEQEFENRSGNRLEGTFLFPVPKGARISQFKMDIGGKDTEAELLNADKARAIYEDIVRKMRDPALLEYAGRDLYKVRIFPIEPNSKKRITVRYVHLLPVDGGMANLTLPLSTQRHNARPLKNVSLKVSLKTRSPLKSIYSPTHTVEIRRDGDRAAVIGFEASEIKPESDFQLFFNQERNLVGGSVLTYRVGEEDGFFLLLASPGGSQGNAKAVRKDITFVLDTSGSMAGAKLEQAKRALLYCIESLNDEDHFEVLRFATDVEPLFDKLVGATKANRLQATEFVKGLRVIGGTAIDDALHKAMSLHDGNSEHPYFVIFLTDGRPTVGNTQEEQILDRVKKESGKTRIFCFGIGHDLNTHLLDRITEETRAASQYVLPEEDIEVKVSNFFAKVKEPALVNPVVHLPEGIRANLLYPSDLPDLFFGEQIVLAGRYKGHGNGKITIEGSRNGKKETFTVEASFPENAKEHDFIPQLWATRRVSYLLDQIRYHGENSELKDETIELARKYGIVTPYTAYLIIEDEKARNVPVARQSLRAYGEDREMVGRSRWAYESLAKEKTGAVAVDQSRTQNYYKMADAPQAAPSGKNDALKGEKDVRLGLDTLNLAASPAAAAAGGSLPASSPAAIGKRMDSYVAQTKFVNGKNFAQNGSTWVDTETQKAAGQKPQRLQFNSTAYFDFANKTPEARPWLALGRNVQFMFKGQMYEIYE